MITDLDPADVYGGIFLFLTVVCLAVVIWAIFRR